MRTDDPGTTSRAPTPSDPDATAPGRPRVAVARLAVVSGPDSGHVFRLAAETVRIGRDDGNGIILTDPTASRWHAEIRCRRGRYVLLDLESGNGIRRNGQRVRAPVILVDGDEITLGETTLSFACSAAREPRRHDRDTLGRVLLLGGGLVLGAMMSLVAWWCLL